MLVWSGKLFMNNLGFTVRSLRMFKNLPRGEQLWELHEKDNILGNSCGGLTCREDWWRESSVVEHLPMLHLPHQKLLCFGCRSSGTLPLYDTTEHILYHRHQRQDLQLCRTWFPVGSLVGWASEHPLRVCLARLGNKEGSFHLETDQGCAG